MHVHTHGHGGAFGIGQPFLHEGAGSVSHQLFGTREDQSTLTVEQRHELNRVADFTERHVERLSERFLTSGTGQNRRAAEGLIRGFEDRVAELSASFSRGEIEGGALRQGVQDAFRRMSDELRSLAPAQSPAISIEERVADFGERTIERLTARFVEGGPVGQRGIMAGHVDTFREALEGLQAAHAAGEIDDAALRDGVLGAFDTLNDSIRGTLGRNDVAGPGSAGSRAGSAAALLGRVDVVA